MIQIASQNESEMEQYFSSFSRENFTNVGHMSWLQKDKILLLKTLRLQRQVVAELAILFQDTMRLF